MLNLFPADFLDSSLTTPVVIGLLWIWLLQERLGWGFSGLVVPGYLASVLIVQPLSAAVIVGEGVATWLLVVATSEAVPRWWPWGRFFGRDRFFHILLASMLVRLALEMEGGGFDLVARFTGVELLGDAHAIGLVLVPLLANSLWRSGLMAGSIRVGMPLILTWAALHFLVLPHTNLSLSDFQLTYEDLALDLDASAKAQILLLSAALLASVANLRLGWDFGGIIVPALMALCWLDPTKILATFAEAIAVALLAALVVQLPGIRRWNLAGGRSLVLCFLLDYGLRFGLAWSALGLRLGLSGHDLYGFGYLLPTLIAVRILHHRQVWRVLVPITLTSLAGFWVGSGVGYAAAIFLPAELPDPLPAAAHLRGRPLDDLLAAAWTSGEGLRLAQVPGHLAKGPPGVQSVAGNGALWIQGEGREVVVAELGPPAMGVAAFGVANAIGARALLLCRPEAGGCARLSQAAESAGFRVLGLVDTTGPAELRLEGDPLSVKAIGALVALIPELDGTEGSGSSLLGDVRLLALPLAARLAVAGAGPLPPVEPWWSLSRWDPPLEAELVQAADLHVLPERVLIPLGIWSTASPEAEPALGTALRGAADLGLHAAVAGDRVQIVGRTWAMELRQGGTPLILHAPDLTEDPGIGAFSLGLFEGLEAAALVLDAPSSRRSELPPRTRSAFLALSALIEARAEPDLLVLDLRAQGGHHNPGAEAVLSLGRRRLHEGTEAALALQAQALFRPLGVESVWYDGSLARLGFQDPENPVRALAWAATGHEAALTAWIAPTLLRRYSPVDQPLHPLAYLADGRELPQVEVGLDALLAQVSDGPVDATLVKRMETLVARPDRASWAALRGAAGRQRLALICAEDLGCRWLRVGRCEGGSCRGSLLSFVRNEAGGDGLPTDRASLLLGGQDLPLRWEEGG